MPQQQFTPSKRPPPEHTKDNPDKVKVYVRFRPRVGSNTNSDPNSHRTSHPHANICPSPANPIIMAEPPHSISLAYPLATKTYHFDHVFTEQENTAYVYQIGCQALVQDMVKAVSPQPSHQGSINAINHHTHLDELNSHVAKQNGWYGQQQSSHALVFVYGNTGTGKTHTMGLIGEVSSNSQGLVPEAIRTIFSMLGQQAAANFIQVSFCQIYNDQVYDLLDFEPTDTKLTIRQDFVSKQPYLERQIAIEVANTEQAYQVINIGLQKRRIAQQKINKRSSRGHGIITISIRNKKTLRFSKLCFVDLAGSERIKQSQSKGATLTEAVSINSSLSALQTLLNNVSEQSVRSYRSCKLTRLLQPFFEAGEIKLFITSNYENAQAIQFGKRCKGIRFLEKPIQEFDIDGKSKDSRSPIRSKSPRAEKEIAAHRKASKKAHQCASVLSIVVHKVVEQLSKVLSTATVKSCFTFEDLLNEPQLEKQINERINRIEEEEQIILDKAEEHLALTTAFKSPGQAFQCLLNNYSPSKQRISDNNSQLIKTQSKNQSRKRSVSPAAQRSQQLQSTKNYHKAIHVQSELNISQPISGTKHSNKSPERPNKGIVPQNTPRLLNTSIELSQSKADYYGMNPIESSSVPVSASHLLEAINQFSNLLQSKNSYKLELFTASLKAKLLERRNAQLEERNKKLEETLSWVRTEVNTKVSKRIQDALADISHKKNQAPFDQNVQKRDNLNIQKRENMRGDISQKKQSKSIQKKTETIIPTQNAKIPNRGVNCQDDTPMEQTGYEPMRKQIANVGQCLPAQLISSISSTATVSPFPTVAYRQADSIFRTPTRGQNGRDENRALNR